MSKHKLVILALFVLCGFLLIFGVLKGTNEKITPCPDASSASTIFDPAIEISSSANGTEIVRKDSASPPTQHVISAEEAARLRSLSGEEECLAIVRMLADSSNDDTVRNEMANLLRRSQYPGLTAALYQILDNPAEKPRFRSFAVQHLWQQIESPSKEDRERIMQKLRELLNDRHVDVQREALLALVRMKDPIGVQAATEWLTLPNHVAHRDLAIRCAYELDLREKIPLIRDLVRDSNEVVRIAAIVALSQWGDEQSRVAFEEASKSPIVRIQRAGKAALDRLDNAKTSVHLNLDSR